MGPSSVRGIACHSGTRPSRACTPRMSMSTSPGTGTGTPASSINKKTKAASSPCCSRNVAIARLISVHQSIMPGDRFLSFDVSIPKAMRTQSVLAIDVGGTKMAVAVVDAEGKVLAQARRATLRTDDAELLFASLVEL